jgi:hypothetical protein
MIGCGSRLIVRRQGVEGIHDKRSCEGLLYSYNLHLKLGRLAESLYFCRLFFIQLYQLTHRKVK